LINASGVVFPFTPNNHQEVQQREIDVEQKAGLQPSDALAERHPWCRPRDAATLILIDRAGPVAKVLVGRRHHNIVFLPGQFVFPGGRVDKTDHRVPIATPVPPGLERSLLKTSPKISQARARALVVAAIREACEETGLCIGRRIEGALPELKGSLHPFAEAGILPDPSGLFLIARAITPPGRVKRYDARSFAADASTIVHRVVDVVLAAPNWSNWAGSDWAPNHWPG